jgi:Fe-S-cluster containining protein
LESKTKEEFLEARTNSLENGTLFLKATPCRYLCGSSCSIYAQRPESCADFPHLYRAHFMFRRLTWEHYTLCPIVFNVIEQLLSDVPSND